jgi:hypothetical protein
MTLALTPAQYAMLLEELPPFRVRQLRGQSHLEAWDVRRTLIRIFGFGGWDLETLELACLREITYAPGELIRKRKDGSTYPNDAPAYTVVYRCQARLIIKNPNGSVGASFDDGAAGDSQNQPGLGDAHDQAMKTALSQALKRCAVNLGDQFGLALYNNGNPKAVVLRTLAAPSGATPSAGAIPHDETPVQGEPEPVDHHDDPVPEALPAVPAVELPHKRMHALWREIGYGGTENREKRLQITAKILGLAELNSSADLTPQQAAALIDALEKKRRAMRQPKPAEVSA